METAERERSGIANLKIRYNRVHGYYIEVSRSQSDQVPDNYQRRQTLKGAERFITPELKEHEDKVLSARSKALEREKTFYAELLQQLLSSTGYCRPAPKDLPNSMCCAPGGTRRYPELVAPGHER